MIEFVTCTHTPFVSVTHDARSVNVCLCMCVCVCVHVTMGPKCTDRCGKCVQTDPYESNEIYKETYKRNSRMRPTN